MINRSTAVCFGEVLWDSTPKGLFLGGAPTNAAYHLHRLGVESLPATAVGNDFLGTEVRRRLDAWGVSTELVATVENKATGVVQVDLSAPSNPTYEIVDDVAWDYIPDTSELRRRSLATDVFIFGSLALRHASNQELLASLLPSIAGMKVFDVNLRAPFYAIDRVYALAQNADLVKVNEDELSVIHPFGVGDVELMAATFSMTVGNAAVCVTCGSSGAGLWRGGKWHWSEARSIETKGDAVGAGDAFLAALVSALLAGISDGEAIERACRLAELVASSDGAQPFYDPSTIFPDS